MPVSRRRFLAGGAALAAGATVARHPYPLVLAAEDDLGQEASPQQAAAPPIEVIALNRMGYGPRPGDVERVRAMGFAAYVAEQLAPQSIPDAECDAKLLAARLKIYYTQNGVVKNQAAPLDLLGKTMPELWARMRLLSDMNMPWQEYMRPWEEVRVATWVRAVYSRRQLNELLVDFWHNHFNVNAGSGGDISASFPVYDAIMRKHCLGNFRAFVEEVGRSTAMMLYLDNANNRTGGLEGGNENYTRELFELHTFGSDHYLKFLPNPDDPTQRSKIQTKWGEFVNGYADDDVYEAARCFTGWTFKNGHWERPTLDDGTFYIDDNWHDSNPKVVLGKYIPRNQGATSDGQAVFDMLAKHPQVARHLCTKLCRRLVSDAPPTTLVDKAVGVWMDNRDAPDQIRKVVEAILLADEFRSTWGQKVKRPFEMVVSYMRATNCGTPVDLESADGKASAGGYWNNLLWAYNQGGHSIFEWPTPTGFPDRSSHWLSTNGLLRRWNMLDRLSNAHPEWGTNTGLDLLRETSALGISLTTSSCVQIVDAWIGRLFGYAIGATTRQAAIDFLAMKKFGGDPSKPPKHVEGEWAGDTNTIPDRVRATIYLLAMSPDFQWR